MTEKTIYAPIAKVDREERMVYGYASTEAVDSQGEVVRKEALAAALPDYMRFANVREMHQPSAVGVAEEAAVDEKGLWIRVKVVDDDAWKKVQARVYKGFSIGGAVTRRDAGDPRIITGLSLAEISLVDRPANPETLFAVYKAAAIGKVGARHSRKDLARVQGIHDMAAALGADCPGKHGGDADDDDSKEALAAALTATRAELARLLKRVEEIEKRPSPAKAALRSFDKSDDYPAHKAEAPTDTQAAIRRAYEGARLVRFIG
ncbi:MAG TPA: XkdF-like putative serine protease domain-containing protein [Stellaceae bacterium]|nr:XkdF-like putative serine protease domain-containing protein [Stellaceae bacterium]